MRGEPRLLASQRGCRGPRMSASRVDVPDPRVKVRTTLFSTAAGWGSDLRKVIPADVLDRHSSLHYFNRPTGAWRSLVAHLHGVQVVAGSNPVAPI